MMFTQVHASSIVIKIAIPTMMVDTDIGMNANNTSRILPMFSPFMNSVRLSNAMHDPRISKYAAHVVFMTFIAICIFPSLAIYQLP